MRRKVKKLKPKEKDTKFLYKRLIDRDLTVTQLAKELGVYPTFISLLFRFKAKSKRIARKVEKRLGLEEGWFEKKWRERDVRKK